jgi:hypothetical protein
VANMVEMMIILKIFSASKEGYKPSAIERHHLEGFIQAVPVIITEQIDSLLSAKRCIR